MKTGIVLKTLRSSICSRLCNGFLQIDQIFQGLVSLTVFLPTIHIQWKLHLAIIPLLAIRSQQIFVHVTTAQLSCHVQNFVAIIVFESRWEWNEISIEFELRWKNRWWNGALNWLLIHCGYAGTQPELPGYTECGNISHIYSNTPDVGYNRPNWQIFIGPLQILIVNTCQRVYVLAKWFFFSLNVLIQNRRRSIKIS